MRVRMKFTKLGSIKYIGHLDLMRYFQKLMRRSDLPIAYSNGMSPHQIMSFALPLGIGDESIGEYADIELTGSVSSTEALLRLQEHSAEGIRILSFRELPDDAKNAMASVEAADYEIRSDDFPEDIQSSFPDFMNREQIMVCKNTKKSSNIIDIKPFIFDYAFQNDALTLRLKCGSVNNTKPELVMQAFHEYLNTDFDEYTLKIKRIDLLTLVNDRFVSLNDIGREI